MDTAIISAIIASANAVQQIYQALTSQKEEFKESEKLKGTVQPVPGVIGIEPPGKRYTLNKFITRNQGFYEHIVDTQKLILDYVARRSQMKPLNLLISAPPGSGKSFLVKQFLSSDGQAAQAVPYLELNIAN